MDTFASLAGLPNPAPQPIEIDYEPANQDSEASEASSQAGSEQGQEEQQTTRPPPAQTDGGAPEPVPQELVHWTAKGNPRPPASLLAHASLLNPEDLLQPERRNDSAPPVSFAVALARARSGNPVSAKKGAAATASKPHIAPKPLAARKPAAPKKAPAMMISAAPSPARQQLIGAKGKMVKAPKPAKGSAKGSAKGTTKPGKGPAKPTKGRRKELELPSSDEEDEGSYSEEEGSYSEEEGSYSEEEEGSYSEEEEGSYSDDEEGSYSDEEEGSYSDEEEGSYSEEQEQEASAQGQAKADPRRPAAKRSAREISERPASSQRTASARPASKPAARPTSKSSSRPTSKNSSRPSPKASARPSSLQRRAALASRRAFQEEEEEEEEDGEEEGSYSEEEEGSYSEEQGSEEGSYSEERPASKDRKAGRGSSRNERAGRGSSRGDKGSVSDSYSSPSFAPPPPARRAPKAISPARQAKNAADEREVLALAIREQEKALKGLHRDLKVLRQIEAAWSIDEEEARRQGIGAQDMALINAFDDEDVAKVREVIDKVAAILETLESEFGQHLRSYQEAVTSMETILETRAKVINRLDRATGIFSRYPELSEFVAGKQSRLTQAMESTQRALLDGFATSLAKVQLTQGQIRDMIQGAASGKAVGRK
jgi:hypothetical protein